MLSLLYGLLAIDSGFGLVCGLRFVGGYVCCRGICWLCFICLMLLLIVCYVLVVVALLIWLIAFDFIWWGFDTQLGCWLWIVFLGFLLCRWFYCLSFTLFGRLRWLTWFGA